MNRCQIFNSYSFHPWLKKSFNRLSAKEKQIAVDFIIAHDFLDKPNFELAVNRMFLEKERTKNWTIISELLSCVNSAF
jgi:hypothetical protein